jgi:hypothetical protein
MAYQLIPNLSYLGSPVYYKISDEKEPTAPIAMVEATAVSDNGNLQSVAAYPVNNSNSNNIFASTRRVDDTEIPGYIKYSDGNHLKEVPRPGYINSKDIRFSFFQENPKKIIYKRSFGERGGGYHSGGFVPIGHFVGAQIVRGEYQYRFSADDIVVYDDYSGLYYDPTSSGGNKRKSYRRKFASIKRKSRKTRKII